MSIFSHVKVRRPKRNVFNLSHEKKISGRMADLIPCLCMEVVPGDTFTGMTEMICRFAPMTHPVMHNINARIEYFFVPNRLIMDGWEDFITGGQHVKGGQVSTPPPIPTFEYGISPSNVNSVDNLQEVPPYLRDGSLCDYLGLPSMDPDIIKWRLYESKGISTRVSGLPFRAYQLIYDDYYRDQNLEDERRQFLRMPTQQYVAGTESGKVILEMDDPDNLLKLQKRAWQKDYFTSALPWAQKGEVDIPITLKEGAEVYLDADDNQQRITDLNGVALPGDATLYTSSGGFSAGQGNPSVDAYLDPNGTLKVDAEADSGTITDLRRAFKLQEWLEKQALAGSRYIETIMSHFGVRGRDARLQRPQFLGGGKIPVVISEVIQHSATTKEGNETTSALGDLAGHAVATGKTASFKYTADEHGYIIGILSVMPETGYMQGVPRHFFKFDKFDYYWPEFAHIGEQEVKNKELFLSFARFQETADGTEGDDQNEGTFGYQSRYSEYKYIPNTVHGDFRSSPLDSWHMARKFASRPNLNNTFIKPGDDTLNRPFAVQEDANEHLWIELYHNIRAKRPMPYFGTPRL